MGRRVVIALAAGVLATTVLTGTAPTAAAASRALAWDFNGDGYRDLAVGVPNGRANGYDAAGFVTVIPGSSTGAVSARRYIVSQESRGVPGGSEFADQFGSQLASIDLNSDGYAELIVAAHGEDIGFTENGGRVTILWGSGSGLGRGTTIDGPGDVGLGGRGLAIGDVTGDGRADIVTAGSGEQETPVHVIKGPFSPGGTKVASSAGLQAHFGVTFGLALGDFDGDGRTDLALAYRGSNDDGTMLLRGTSTGLKPVDGWYHQTTGASLAGGDFNADGYGDLAYGVASTGVNDEGVSQYPVPPSVGGVLRILYGGPQGPAGTRAPANISQETPGVPGSGAEDTEQDDGFGTALTVANIDGDGYPDLGIGTPLESFGSSQYVGSVTVLYGTAAGIAATRAQYFTQGTSGVSGTNEQEDVFGSAVRLRDLNGNVRPELIIGVPGEFEGIADDDFRSGRVLTLPGSKAGITGTGSKSYSSTGLKLPGAATLFFGRIIG